MNAISSIKSEANGALVSTAWPELPKVLDGNRLTATTFIFLQAIAELPDLPERMAKMAQIFRGTEQTKDARLIAAAARKLAPQDYRIRALCDWLTRREAPMWHFGIVHDHARNEAYAQALNHYVQPGMTVFEIGTGTGILAMLAARAGADHVYTCERSPDVAKAAQAIIECNGLSDRITVIAKDAHSLQLGVDIPHRADLFVAEIVDDSLLGEMVLPLTELARRHFLKPNAILLPQRISSMACLISGHGCRENFRVNEVMGFDLTAFNRFSPVELSADKGGGEFEALSDPIELAGFDLRKDTPVEDSHYVELVTTMKGDAEAVMRWLRLDFGAGIVFENKPPQKSSWGPVLHILPRSHRVTPGEKVSIEICHTHERLFVIPQL
jgi:hypothetical protein